MVQGSRQHLGRKPKPAEPRLGVQPGRSHHNPVFSVSSKNKCNRHHRMGTADLQLRQLCEGSFRLVSGGENIWIWTRASSAAGSIARFRHGV